MPPFPRSVAGSLVALAAALTLGCGSLRPTDDGRPVKAVPRCGGLLPGDCNAADFTNTGPAWVSFMAETACVAPGTCGALVQGTRDAIFQRHCERNYAASCRSCTTCSSPASCRAIFDASGSRGINLVACVGVPPPPGCVAPDIGCKCTPEVAPAGRLDCDCGCR
jgi:hypothetical protein